MRERRELRTFDNGSLEAARVSRRTIEVAALAARRCTAAAGTHGKERTVAAGVPGPQPLFRLIARTVACWKRLLDNVLGGNV